MGDKRTLPQLLSLIELKTQFSLVYIDVWEPSIVLLFDFLITSFLLRQNIHCCSLYHINLKLSHFFQS